MEAGAPSVCLTVSLLPPLASPLIFNKQQLRLSATGPTVCPNKNDYKEGGNKKKKQTNKTGEKKSQLLDESIWIQKLIQGPSLQLYLL